MVSLLLIGLVVSAGCIRTEPGPNANVYVGFFGDMNAEDSTFTMDGRITLGGGVADRDVYRAVIVYLFAENGTLLRSHEVGDMRRPLDVNFTANVVPYYVVIDSPDFWTEDDFVVRYYHRIDSDGTRDYGQSRVQSRDELPVTVPARNVSNP